MSDYDIHIRTSTEEIVYSGISRDNLEREKRRLEVTNPGARILVRPKEPDSFFDKRFGVNN